MSNLFKPFEQINKNKLFSEEQAYGHQVLLPMLQNKNIPLEGKRILDLGCACGGMLQSLSAFASNLTGLDREQTFIDFARNSVLAPNISFLQADIENPQELKQKLSEKRFDLILLFDVLEHIKEPQQFLSNVQHLLNEKGILLIAFPPWRSAFGGHSHGFQKTYLKIPYIHLWPTWVHHYFLHEPTLQQEVLNYVTPITIPDFYMFVKKANFKLVFFDFYILRPRFSVKYGIPTWRCNYFSVFPRIGEFFVSACIAALTPA